MNYSFLIILGIFWLALILFQNKPSPPEEQQLGGSQPKIEQNVMFDYPTEGLGTSANFSYLNQSIGDGNDASWADIQNPIVYRDQFYTGKDKPNNVYFGSPNPLMHQMRPMTSPDDSMFYFANAKFSPECCLGGAPYSTSSGCVCAFPKQMYKCQNEPVTALPIPGPNSWQGIEKPISKLF